MSKFELREEVRCLIYNKPLVVVAINNINGYCIYDLKGDNINAYNIEESEIEKIGEKQMTKDDLKSGMIVEYRCGTKRLVMPYGLVNKDGWTTLHLSRFNEDLTHLTFKDHDIIKVYDIYESGFDWECEYRKLLWERKEVKLTEQERVLLESLDKKYNYIARDKDGNLYVYEIKPRKYNSTKKWDNVLAVSFRPFNHLFTFITWKDDEPRNIKELLENE